MNGELPHIYLNRKSQPPRANPMTLPADKYLIEALGYGSNFNIGIVLCLLKSTPSHYPNTIAHARALERIAELEAQLGPYLEQGLPVYFSETAARFKRERDDAMARIDHLEKTKVIQRDVIVALGDERDEALAKLAKYEPPVDPDMALAREIVAKLGAERTSNQTRAILNGNAGSLQVDLALAGIKAGRELGGGL